MPKHLIAESSMAMLNKPVLSYLAPALAFVVLAAVLALAYLVS